MTKQYYEYITQFNKDNYDRIVLIVPKGTKSNIKEEASKAKKTMNDFILSMIPQNLICSWKKKGEYDNE